jgi:hypothetical protein
LDTSIPDKPQCVPQSQCSCYDSESNSYVKAGSIVSRACGNWYEYFCIYFFFEYFIFSTCNNAQWNCGSQVCETKMACPTNQIYSVNASACPKTCDNMNTWQDCGVTYEGCTCPTGQVLSQDVSHYKN